MKTKFEISGIIRTLLSAIGAFLVGQNIFGHAVDAVWWQEVVGIIMAIVSIVWSVLDKTATVEAVQGALRQVITFVGGLMVGAGKATDQTVQAVLGLAAALAPFIQGYLSRVKNQQIDSGKIPIHALKK